MSKKAPKKKKKAAKPKPHGRRAMLRWDGNWVASKFEFDASDGCGVKWHYARSCGGSDPMGEAIRILREKGYTIVEWSEDV